ncbi:hypothetical protein T11_12011 [Trichinella zimbabwensis]|uniref:Uncharacterized protein n=1 Tax=Trichinella zimbabwensis TaxID=268475 RepID=A0A0V1GEQ6_9BILA|nr:hypothetical protein T11_12011 [Trichinella zimbabwensis]
MIVWHKGAGFIQPRIAQSAFSVTDANCGRAFVRCEKSSQKCE